MSLELSNDPDALELLAASVTKFAEQQGWPDGTIFKIDLVLEELFVNAMAYGNPDGLVEVGVTVTSGDDVVAIEISDNGVAFNPLADAPEPEVESSIEDRRVGGLGLHLVRTMMDGLSYRREHGRNHLTMTTPRD